MTDPDQTVDILMGIYNGAEVLPQQLASIVEQSHSNWRLICSNDGKEDGGPALIEAFDRAQPQPVEMRRGPGAGFAANYMAMIRDLDPTPNAVAFADQDDIWLPDKLTRAMAALAKAPPDSPTLYCARRWLWYPQKDAYHATPPILRAPSFRNALIENIAPGNTLVLNPAAAHLARVAAQRTGAVFAHDWWLYLLVSGAGGLVIADPGAPSLLYRQHRGNLIGGNTGAYAQIRRKWQALQGTFSERMRGNIEAMQAVSDLLTPENRHLTEAFASARVAGVGARIAGLAHIAPYRQSRMGTCGFWGGALLGRI